MKIECKDLVQQFVAAGRALVAELSQHAGMQISAENIATVLCVIPRQGVLPSETRYAFHGIGCRFEKKDGTVVDIDFGPEPGRIGVDEYRLHEFATTTLSSNAPERLALKGELEAGKRNGELEKLQMPRWEHLFFFSGRKEDAK